jgi:uncharacterized protein
MPPAAAFAPALACPPGRRPSARRCHARMSAATPFSVRNARGERLACLLDVPSSHAAPAPAPVAVLVHGFRDSKEGHCISTVAAELLARSVFQCVRFDCSGNGESEGTFQFSNYRDEAEDLRAVIVHVRTSLKRRVDCIIGHSKGADVVLLYASKYHDVPFVVNLAARYEMGAGVEERFGADTVAQLTAAGSVPVTLKDGFKFTLSREALDERLGLDMEAAARAIPAHVQVLTVHGAADKTIPVADGEKFHSVIANSRLCILPDCNHNFRDAAAAAVDAIQRHRPQ